MPFFTVKDAGQAAYLTTVVGIGPSRTTRAGYRFDADHEVARSALASYVGSIYSQFDGHVMSLRRLRDHVGMAGLKDPVYVSDIGTSAYLVLLKFRVNGASKDGGFWFAAGSEDERRDIGAAVAEYVSSDLAKFFKAVSELCAKKGRAK